MPNLNWKGSSHVETPAEALACIVNIVNCTLQLTVKKLFATNNKQKSCDFLTPSLSCTNTSASFQLVGRLLKSCLRWKVYCPMFRNPTVPPHAHVWKFASAFNPSLSTCSRSLQIYLCLSMCSRSLDASCFSRSFSMRWSLQMMHSMSFVRPFLQILLSLSSSLTC